MITSREAERDAKRLWRACLVNGRPDGARVRELVDGLLEMRHATAPRVLSRFLRLVRIESARRSARVESAAPLDASDRLAVQNAIVRTYGRNIETNFVIDPALIAGMRLTVGSERYDGTVRARLAAIEEQVADVYAG
jgi:F-type H+-transporting ATPase subunit delta